MKLGDMLCPWHPGMTLFECKDLHAAVTSEGNSEPGCSQSPTPEDS